MIGWQQLKFHIYYKSGYGHQNPLVLLTLLSNLPEFYCERLSWCARKSTS